MKNWFTSICGILVIGGGVFCFTISQPIIAGTLIAAGLGLLGAKDAKNKE